MSLGSSFRKFAGALAALALCASSTGAIAAAAPHPATVSPFVALSALGSGVSAAALAANQAPSPAVVDSSSAAAAAVAADTYAPDSDSAVSPLLLALVAIAAAVGIYYLAIRGNDNFHIIFPTSPA
jgi:hypothetical protein